MSNSDSSRYDRELRAARTHQGTHEKDERWTAVDNYATSVLHTPDSPYWSAINHVVQLSEQKKLPNIEVSLMQGRWLLTQCQLMNAKRVLEVGTLGGFSAIWMALSGPDVKVTTVEIDPERKAVAEEAIAHAGLSDRVEVLLGAGVDVLPKVRQEVDSGQRLPFDFVFIDADKPNNLNYFNESIRMTRSRACIIVDNVVRRGQLADDEVALTDPGVSGARRVIEAVGKDDRVMGRHVLIFASLGMESTLLQTVGEKNYDGVLLCVVK